MFPHSARVRLPLAFASLAFVFVAVVITSGCAKKEEVTVTTDTTGTATAPVPGDTATAAAPSGTEPVAPATPPDHVEVIHVLIAFDGSIPNTPPMGRTRAQAESLATQVLKRARSGEDFDQLMITYSNDTQPGILYKLSNTGVAPNKAQGEFGRDEMVKGFSDVAFSLSPGNIGMSPYDAKTSPFGWHIIKRLR